jgi:nucleoside-diphosphate-sugar epimerase
MILSWSSGSYLIYEHLLQPPMVENTTLAAPQSAYGACKLISELLINEYTRRGFVDGRILRLPTVIVRPGPPASATSAFLSGIL